MKHCHGHGHVMVTDVIPSNAGTHACSLMNAAEFGELDLNNSPDSAVFIGPRLFFSGKRMA